MTQTASPAADPHRPLIDALTAIAGSEHVLTDLSARTFHATDLAGQGPVPACVVAPGSADELSRLVAHSTGAGYAVIARGGGFSYTGGYLPIDERSVMFDLRRMNRIVEVNEIDLYVTVECGCTWRELYEALKARGLRTPYFGPMSGYWATVGGALSQGSFFLGSSEHGTAAESVLSLEVVLADGGRVRTGSGGGVEVDGREASPFFRWYGPDLSGLFLSDTGAMGIKTRATLRLMPWPEHQRYATFALDNLAGCISVIAEIGRNRLAAECYSWDPTFVKSVGERTGMLKDIKFLAGVVGSGSSFLTGMKDAARIAMAGKRVLDGSSYLVHVTIDDVTAGGAEDRLELVQAIAAKHGGGEVEASVPRATRGLPFIDFKNQGLATKGIVRSLPTNALCPPSRAQALARETEAFFEQRKALMAEHGITFGIIAFAVGAHIICIEPLIYWHDAQYALHDRIAERSNLAGLAKFDAPPPAAQVATAIRRDMIELFTRLGCAHVQIGKSYRWAETRQPESLQLLRELKHTLDPQNRMNPGSLGL